MLSLKGDACADSPFPVFLHVAAGSLLKVNERIGGLREIEVSADAVFNPSVAKLFLEVCGLHDACGIRLRGRGFHVAHEVVQHRHACIDVALLLREVEARAHAQTTDQAVVVVLFNLDAVVSNEVIAHDATVGDANGRFNKSQFVESIMPTRFDGKAHRIVVKFALHRAGSEFVLKAGILADYVDEETTVGEPGAIERYAVHVGIAFAHVERRSTVNLTNASINVGETKAKNGVNIGSNGTLIVDASVDDGQEGNLSTDVTGKITGEKGSTIHYVHVADKGVVEVEHEGFTTVTVDNLLYKVVKVENEDNQYTFKIATGSELAGTGLEHFDGAALDGMADNEVIGSLLDQANTAITSGSQREARLNGALNLAAAGGVQTAGIEAATMGIDQATKRAAFSNVFQDGWTGFAEVTGTSLKMGGDSGALETKTELGGITVGGEYTMGDMTFGVMGNFGTGDVEGEGDNNGAKNDVDYYGVQGYTAKRMGQFNLVGQMGLMTTKNDVTSADGDSADIDATIFTIGARGEMAFQISKSCQAVPYVGLNYLRVATDGYNTAKGLSVDDMDQNLVSMPIGVAFSGNMDLASGWTLRPTVDVAYVHTFGDTDVEATTKFGAAAINTNLDVWSENVGRVGFGLEARKDALSFGGQIGGAFGDNDHREFYGQLNMKYLF